MLAAGLFYAVQRSVRRPKRLTTASLVAAALLAPLGYVQYRAYANVVDPTFYQREAFPFWLHARDDETVFVVSPFPVFPQTVYYAQRNIQRVDSVEAARNWLRESGTSVQKGIVFHALGHDSFERISRE